MSRRQRQRERGYSLMVVMAVITLLSMTGVMVLTQASQNIELGGADNVALQALYMAELGAQQGRSVLTNKLYPNGFAQGQSAQLSTLQTLPRLPQNDPLCPENSCRTPPCPAPVDCSQYILLAENNLPAATPGGQGWRTYVGVSCSPSCSVSEPVGYTLRAISMPQNGTSPRRVVEIDLGGSL